MFAIFIIMVRPRIRNPHSVRRLVAYIARVPHFDICTPERVATCMDRHQGAFMGRLLWRTTIFAWNHWWTTILPDVIPFYLVFIIPLEITKTLSSVERYMGGVSPEAFERASF